AQAVVIYSQPVAETLDNRLFVGLMVISIAAMYGGVFIRQKVPTQLFRKLILVILLMLAVFLLVTSLTKMF
ncbi:MAG: hypothetical protein KDJ97_18205, partial [Anaerolineae bacterium]|nr:hypothetical protein [Anaerolineae bacterium]